MGLLGGILPFGSIFIEVRWLRCACLCCLPVMPACLLLSMRLPRPPSRNYIHAQPHTHTCTRRTHTHTHTYIHTHARTHIWTGGGQTYFLFTSFWHYKWYYVYGFLLLVFVILVVVAVCVTIVSTYFLLNAENYHWQWNAFFSGASTGLYVFVYSIYYFVVKVGWFCFVFVLFCFCFVFPGCFCGCCAACRLVLVRSGVRRMDVCFIGS